MEQFLGYDFEGVIAFRHNETNELRVTTDMVFGNYHTPEEISEEKQEKIAELTLTCNVIGYYFNHRKIEALLDSNETIEVVEIEIKKRIHVPVKAPLRVVLNPLG